MILHTALVLLFAGTTAFAPLPIRQSFRGSLLHSASVDIAEQDLPRFDYAASLPESEYSQVLISELPIANDLRQFYDDFFKDPRQPDGARFAWDPWFVQVGDGKFGESVDVEDGVPGEAEATQRQTQYSLKRIQTSEFFTDDLYEKLVDDLVDVANSVGLTAITPPWISLYTEGDMQNFHTDAPNGPLAFVLSLCQEGEFVGGETMMFQPKMLEYWRGFDGSNGLECGSIVRCVLNPDDCICAIWRLLNLFFLRLL
jgi:hypothetical protein